MRTVTLLLAVLGLAVAVPAAADLKDECFDTTYRAASVCSKLPPGVPSPVDVP